MSDSDKDRVEGLGSEAKGRIQQGIGGVTGDRQQQAEGGAEEAKGNIQQGLGDLKDKLTGNDK